MHYEEYINNGNGEVIYLGSDHAYDYYFFQRLSKVRLAFLECRLIVKYTDDEFDYFFTNWMENGVGFDHKHTAYACALKMAKAQGLIF